MNDDYVLIIIEDDLIVAYYLYVYNVGPVIVWITTISLDIISCSSTKRTNTYTRSTLVCVLIA